MFGHHEKWLGVAVAERLDQFVPRGTHEQGRARLQGYGRVQGERWIPYQAPNVVTPPFPEYVSGHSTFSSAAAAILAKFTGSDSFGAGVTIEAGTSLFEPRTGTQVGTPATNILLSWPTFSRTATTSASGSAATSSPRPWARSTAPSAGSRQSTGRPLPFPLPWPLSLPWPSSVGVVVVVGGSGMVVVGGEPLQSASGIAQEALVVTSPSGHVAVT